MEALPHLYLYLYEPILLLGTTFAAAGALIHRCCCPLFAVALARMPLTVWLLVAPALPAQRATTGRVMLAPKTTSASRSQQVGVLQAALRACCGCEQLIGAPWCYVDKRTSDVCSCQAIASARSPVILVVTLPAPMPALPSLRLCRVRRGPTLRGMVTRPTP